MWAHRGRTELCAPVALHRQTFYKAKPFTSFQLSKKSLNDDNKVDYICNKAEDIKGGTNKIWKADGKQYEEIMVGIPMPLSNWVRSQESVSRFQKEWMGWVTVYGWKIIQWKSSKCDITNFRKKRGSKMRCRESKLNPHLSQWEISHYFSVINQEIKNKYVI